MAGPVKIRADGLASVRGGARLLVLGLFVGSGAASLVLEVVWARMLGTVFGNTVLAASTVLTAFMLGLALGSAWVGRRVDGSERPLFWYGGLEVGVGLYAWLFPWLMDGAGACYSWFYRMAEPGPWALNGVRFGLSLLLLLPPTFLMGGTLPVLARHLGLRHREPGQEVGYLYALNTFGGVLGCFLAGFFLLEWLGVRGTLGAAGGAACGIGGLAMVLSRRAGAKATTRVEKAPSPGQSMPLEPVRAGPATSFYLVLAAFGVAGFCSLAYQVIWTRILLFLLTTTVYAFATMLTAFLTGIALGSLIAARWLVPRLRRPLLWFGVLEILVGLAALASAPLLAHLGVVDAKIASQVRWGGLGQLVVTYLADNFVVLLLPTVLMGAVFPVVTAGVLRGEIAVGRRVGQVYAANTLGCVVGSWLAGFVLIPLWGTQYSLLLVVGLNLLIGVVLVGQAVTARLGRRLALTVPALGLVAAALYGTPAEIFHRTINLFHSPSRIVFLEEHSTGTVTVHELPNQDRIMAVDGVDVAGLDLMLRTTQKLQGYIPLVLHPQPRRVLQIGFGSGETTRVGLEFGVEDYSVVEICPAVFRAGPHFEAINQGAYRDPRVRRLIMDGKNYVRLTERPYDLIMNDSIFPGSSGSAALYTVDHFRQCRARLAEGGMLSCWVPLDLRPRELRMILKSFQSVFPHTSVWVASNTLNKQGLILGSLTPLRIDLARVAGLLRRPEIAAELAAVALADVYDFLDCHMTDGEAIARLVAADPVNTDDRPRLEFSCALRIPWTLRLRQTLAMLTAHRAPVLPYVTNFVDEAKDRAELGRRYDSTTHLFRAQVAQLAELPKVRRQELDRALALSPADPQVRSCEAELEKEIDDLAQLAQQAEGGPRTFRLRLAAKLYLAMRWEEAARIYEPLLGQGPPAPAEVYAHLAEMRYHVGEAEAAEQWLRQGLAHWPNSAQAHDLLAGILLNRGDVEGARRHIELAVELQPGDPLYRQHRAEILRRLAQP
ncbi:MAG: hypothetical protein FJ387_15175 [Verrucomicrobia bacterium]|nr:hypothetical protein [Verrucomicrobiota bacterium]